MTNNKIDAALDSVLKASGSGLQYYTTQKNARQNAGGYAEDYE